MAITRSEIEILTDENIYDNSNKEIDPSMVRAVIEALKDSYFNLLDDELSGYKYDATRVLSDVISLPLSGSTGTFNVGTGSGSISGNSGIVSSSSITTNGSDSFVTINLSQDISDRKATIDIFSDSADLNDSNDITLVSKIISGTQIEVGFREVSSNTQSISIQILAFKTE